MIVDLYAGAGGVSTGLQIVQRRHSLDERVVGLELDPLACMTATAAGHERIRADVYGYDPTKLLKLAGPEGVTGLHASPPCGGLSSSGLGLGADDVQHVIDLVDCLVDGHDHRADYLMHWQDLRSPLMAEPMRYLIALEPEWFTLEQVPEALDVWETYAAHLSDAGWFVDVGIVNARWFGVPQDRERVILVAHRTRPVLVPGGPVLDADGGYALVPASTVVGPGELGFPRRNDRPDGGAYRARDMRSTDRPSFTVTEKARSWTHVSPDGTRRQLEVDEVGRLQSFPAGYPWQGDRSRACLQAANAVPPLMYAGIVEQLVRPL